MSGSVNYGYFNLKPTNANTTAFCYRDKQFPVMLQGKPKTWANCIEKLCRLVQAGMFVLWIAPKSAKLGMAIGVAYGTLREAFNLRIRTADEFSIIHKIGAATLKKHALTKSSVLLGVGTAAGYTISRWMPLVPHLTTQVLGFCQGFSDGALATTMGFEGLRNVFKAEAKIPLTPEASILHNTHAPDWLNAPDSLRWIDSEGTPWARKDSDSPKHVFNGKTWEETDQTPSYVEVNQPSEENGLSRFEAGGTTFIVHQKKLYASFTDNNPSKVVEYYSTDLPLLAKANGLVRLFVDGKWYIQVADNPNLSNIC